jgi:hypothetical protein
MTKQEKYKLSSIVEAVNRGEKEDSAIEKYLKELGFIKKDNKTCPF